MTERIVVGRGPEVPVERAFKRWRWKDFVARMDAVPTAKPRAMGKDAP